MWLPMILVVNLSAAPNQSPHRLYITRTEWHQTILPSILCISAKLSPDTLVQFPANIEFLGARIPIKKGLVTIWYGHSLVLVWVTKKFSPRLTHYSDVTWAPWRPKSPTTRMLLYLFELTAKEIQISALLLWVESNDHQWISLTKGQ